MFYRIFRVMVAITLRLFFRRIEILGRQNVPDAGPVLLVSNHTNALVDPLFPLVILHRRVTLTAKNVLGRNPLLAVLSWGLGSIPFHRKEDQAKGADPRQNVKAMQLCRQKLAEGGAICVFPEGISHSDLKMRPFHPGAARIALDFVRKDGDPGGLKVVPIGLLYTAKSRFGSEVCVTFGGPLDVGGWAARRPKAHTEELTEELRSRVEALTIAYQDRREMLLLNWANQIAATEARMPMPLGTSMASPGESFRRLARFQAGYRALLPAHSGEVNELARRVRDYQHQLKSRGVEPAEVYLPVNPMRAMLFLLREVELIVIGAPLAFFGIINHLFPYLIVRGMARKLSSDQDHWATNVIYPSLVVFPFCYAIQLAAAWFFLPVLWAAIYTVALPYTGYYAVLYRERAGSALRRARTFLYFLLRPGVQRHLMREGRQILSGIDELGRHLTAPAP